MREEHLGAHVIVMTGYSTVKNAVEAMKLGAFDYVSKPFTDDETALEAMKLGATDYLCKPFTDDDLIKAVENAFPERATG